MTLKPDDVLWIVVHCAATPPGMDIGVDEIRRWHMLRGWSDVGYHYVIRRDGKLERGRRENVAGAHARGYNSKSLGVCLIGGAKRGFPNKAQSNFTPHQYLSLQTLLDDLKTRYPDAEILGHRDLPGVNKACPSFDVREWLRRNHEDEERALQSQDDPACSI